MSNIRKNYTEITLLHVTGAGMILMCHFCQKLHISSLGELFICGVPLFLFVSGFLMGKSSGVGKQSWIKRRTIRILTPFYLWIIPIMMCLWLSNHSEVTGTQGTFLLFNLQGLNYIYWKSEIYSAVLGLGHLWFVTEIMLCTILTPLFARVIDKTKGLVKYKWLGIMVGVIVFIQPLLMAIGFQTSYIITYFLGMLVAKIEVSFDNKNFLKISLTCVIITILRFIGMKYIDGTDYYDRYLALVSSAAIGIWIFCFVFWLRKKMPRIVDGIANQRVIIFLSSVSYEIYIVHFWFLNGKWQIQNYVSNWLLSDILIVGVTVFFAWILSRMSLFVKEVFFHE